MNYIIKGLVLTIFLSISSYASSETINIDKLSKQSLKENKHVLIFFHMTYCPYCEKMINESFEDVEIKKVLKKYFIMVDVNTTDDENIIYKKFKGDKSDFAKMLNISFFPTVMFLDQKNNITHTVKGYRNKSKFKLILDFIKSKSYKEMDFNGYLDEIELNKD
jgi:thioredoxin-related protein